MAGPGDNGSGEQPQGPSALAGTAPVITMELNQVLGMIGQIAQSIAAKGEMQPNEFLRLEFRGQAGEPMLAFMIYKRRTIIKPTGVKNPEGNKKP